MHKTHLHVNLQNVTVNISQLIESTLPEEYAERKQIHEEEMKKLARWEHVYYFIALII